MQIIYSKRAVKTIHSLDSSTKKRLKDAIESIPAGDIKPLKGTPNRLRLRVGSWRVIFAYKGVDTVLIDKIASRGKIYKGAKP